MTKPAAQKLKEVEELHEFGYAIYFSEDGSREIEVEVCTHCEEHAGLTYAAEWPCLPIQEATEAADIECAIEQGPATHYEPTGAETNIGEAVVSMDGKTERVITWHVVPEEAITCLACMTPSPQCAQPKAHEFLYIPTDGARELGILSSVFYSDRGTMSIDAEGK